MKPPTREALLEAIRLIVAADNDEMILVGGMAVDFYRALYRIQSELIELTTDIDFFGGRTAIEDAAQALEKAGKGVKEFIASMDDPTPNSGKLAVYRDEDARGHSGRIGHVLSTCCLVRDRASC